MLLGHCVDEPSFDRMGGLYEVGTVQLSTRLIYRFVFQGPSTFDIHLNPPLPPLVYLGGAATSKPCHRIQGICARVLNLRHTPAPKALTVRKSSQPI